MSSGFFGSKSKFLNQEIIYSVPEEYILSDITNISAYDQIRFMIRFAKSQK
ncbi:hypothetical protein ACFIJ5_08455 [Haloimpatiens sp. FM7330]|uniref:hypothetical protein n=1 Tax=Haloimpatiens sp. FM7330 TaxID=3298610 RepID=UPI003634C064